MIGVLPMRHLFGDGTVAMVMVTLRTLNSSVVVEISTTVVSHIFYDISFCCFGHVDSLFVHKGSEHDVVRRSCKVDFL